MGEYYLLLADHGLVYEARAVRCGFNKNSFFYNYIIFFLKSQVPISGAHSHLPLNWLVYGNWRRLDVSRAAAFGARRRPVQVVLTFVRIWGRI